MSLDHEWLIKFIEHRIADQRVVRLIRKWLNAGVLEEGQWTCSEEGTPQGGSASPLLANIYLHYVFDLWVQHWRKTKAKGDVIVVRWLMTSWWALSTKRTLSGFIRNWRSASPSSN